MSDKYALHINMYIKNSAHYFADISYPLLDTIDHANFNARCSDIRANY